MAHRITCLIPACKNLDLDLDLHVEEKTQGQHFWKYSRSILDIIFITARKPKVSLTI